VFPTGHLDRQPTHLCPSHQVLAGQGGLLSHPGCTDHDDMIQERIQNEERTWLATAELERHL
jgi:hypothetical protein